MLPCTGSCCHARHAQVTYPSWGREQRHAQICPKDPKTSCPMISKQCPQLQEESSKISLSLYLGLAIHLATYHDLIICYVWVLIVVVVLGSFVAAAARPETTTRTTPVLLSRLDSCAAGGSFSVHPACPWISQRSNRSETSSS